MGAIKEKFRAVLQHSKDVGDLVECYCDSDESDYPIAVIGFVEAVNDLQFSLNTLDSYGEPDGLVSMRLDEIVRLHVGGQQAENLRILFENRGQIFKTELIKSENLDLADHTDALKFAKDNRLIVSVTDDFKGVNSGFVSEIGEDWIQIEPIQLDGTSNGFAIFRTEDIARISIGGKQEQSRSFIHQARLGS